MDNWSIGSVVDAWAPKGVGPGPAAFARTVVGAAVPPSPARARSLLWAASRAGAWAESVGLELRAEVVLAVPVIERYMLVGHPWASELSRRTQRANLRFLARRILPVRPPAPAGPPRARAKAAYSAAEVAGFLALAAAQPTEARRHRLGGYLCAGLGAGLAGAELRGLTGEAVMARDGGLVVEVGGARARVVPVLARYGPGLAAAAVFAGARPLCGGSSPTRKNLTADLVGRLAGGGGLPRLEGGRLRSTWLAEHLDRLGLSVLMAAAGLSCSQRLGDLAAAITPVDQDQAMVILGAR